jgi:hypothetical protein
MPRWTCGSLTPGSSLGPIVPTPSPSATVAPFVTAIEPRCVSVTDQPSAVSIVTHLPFVGTLPAKETTPVAGARTTAPGVPATSIPRCWSAAFGNIRSNENAWSTTPSTGHVHALADGMTASAAMRTNRIRRMSLHLFCPGNGCSIHRRNGHLRCQL